MEAIDELNILKSIVETVEGNLTAEEVKSKLNWHVLKVEKEPKIFGVKYTIEFEVWK